MKIYFEFMVRRYEPNVLLFVHYDGFGFCVDQRVRDYQAGTRTAYRAVSQNLEFAGSLVLRQRAEKMYILKRRI